MWILLSGNTLAKENDLATLDLGRFGWHLELELGTVYQLGLGSLFGGWSEIGRGVLPRACPKCVGDKVTSL
jgi:hypothetical protein